MALQARVAILKASIPELATFLDLGGVSTPGELREILGAALVAMVATSTIGAASFVAANAKTP